MPTWPSNSPHHHTSSSFAINLIIAPGRGKVGERRVREGGEREGERRRRRGERGRKEAGGEGREREEGGRWGGEREEGRRGRH